MGLRSFSNCIAFAVAFCWRRRHKRDWYFAIRMSRHGPFIHALCGRRTRDGKIRVVSYIPRYPKQRWIPPPLFDGFTKWGDNLPHPPGGSVDDTKP
jgi:hypothetical protein